MTTDEARRYTTEEARAALRAFLSERWSLCVPPQPTDPDMILDAVITERDALLAQSAALRDQLARAEAVVQAARDWLACEVRAVALTTQIFEYGAGCKGPDDYYPTDAEHAQLVELSEDGIAVEEALRAAVQALAARTPTPGAAGEVG